MRLIVHYPWRIWLERREWNAVLPMPAEGEISPELGAFSVVGNQVEELPGPTVLSGVGQERHEALRYASSAHQYGLCRVNDPCRRLHFSMADLFVRLSDFLYGYREASGDCLADRALEMVPGELVAYRNDVRDFAPESLIVRAARKTAGLIRDVTEHPREVLIRRHSEVPLDRIQEVDVRVLEEYARRPGRTAAMKAGSRQRLPAVVRQESPNTYENRVVRAFVELAARGADQYLAEMCVRCPRHEGCSLRNPRLEAGCPSERMGVVRAFGAFCRRALRAPGFVEVATLGTQAAIPNYVLQQEARYLGIWRFYRLMLRQEDVEAQVWRWRRNSWGDLMRLLAIEFWSSRLHLMEGFSIQTSRKPLMIRPDGRKGRWLCPDPFEDAAVFDRGEDFLTLYLLNPSEAVRLPGCEGVRRLHADFFWIVLSGLARFHPKVVPVWCFLPDLAWEQSGLVSSSDGHSRGACDWAEVACEETQLLSSKVVAEAGTFDIPASLILVPGDRPQRLGARGAHAFWSVDAFKFDGVSAFFDWLEGLIGRVLS